MKTKFLICTIACIAIAIAFLSQSCSKRETGLSATKLIKKINWTPGQPLVNGTYTVININSGKSLDVPNGSLSNGALLQQWDYISPNLFFPNQQKWTIHSLGSGYYTVTNLNSGKVVDVPGGVVTQGQQLQQYDYVFANSEQWKIDPVGFDLYKFTNKATGLVMTVKGSSKANGAQVAQYSDSSSHQSQWWQIHQVAYKEAATTNFFTRQTGFVSGDGGNSVKLSDGRVLWFFGDCALSKFGYDPATKTIPCKIYDVRNCVIAQPASGSWDPTLSPTLPGNMGTDTYFIRTTDMSYSIQVLNAFQQLDTVYVYTINTHGSDPTTHSFAKINPSTLAVVGYKDLASTGDISFGQGFIKDVASGYYYAYGQKQVNTPLSWPEYVARFPISNPNAPWKYWNGSTWVDSVSAAASIATFGSFSTNVYKLGSKYVAVSTGFSLACDMDSTIYVSVSASPTGPFSTPKSIYTIEDRLSGHRPFFYGANLHPEYINSNNEILMTYDIHQYSPCSPSCVSGRQSTDGYLPRGVRVPMSMIDPSL